jgi:clan AA aspartic protease (TIGR02281 family)
MATGSAIVRPVQAATQLWCLPAHTLVGDNNPSPGNRVVKTYVYHSDVGWLIYHTLESNYIVNRSEQYSIRDSSVAGATQQWTGIFERNPSLIMIGEIKTNHDTAQILYIESIYDKDKNGAVIVRTVAQCNLTPGPTSPTVVASSSLGSLQVDGREPTIVSDGQGPTTIVSMHRDGGTFMVPVMINGQITLKFVVDSGATDVTIPADVVMTLVRTGTITNEDFLGKQTYTMADGSTVPSQQFVIRSLRIGGRVVENVTGSIAPVAGGLLLGQSFLGRFHSWSIDNQKEALVLD